MKAMVVGLGRVGWRYSLEKGRGFTASHLGAYYAQENIDTIIAVDKDEKRLSECARWINKVHQSPKKKVLFTSNVVDAIRRWAPEVASVCVPTPLHYHVMRELCQERGGPEVICLEKPVAPSLKDTETITNEVSQAGSKFGKPKVAVNLTRRWDDAYQRVKRLIDQGRIGKPILAIGSHPGPLLRSGIHMLDLFNWYLGEPKGGSEMIETNDWNGSGLIPYKNDRARS
jgi:predicted dehydrogenase